MPFKLTCYEFHTWDWFIYVKNLCLVFNALNIHRHISQICIAMVTSEVVLCVTYTFFLFKLGWYWSHSTTHTLCFHFTRIIPFSHIILFLWPFSFAEFALLMVSPKMSSQDIASVSVVFRVLVVPSWSSSLSFSKSRTFYYSSHYSCGPHLVCAEERYCEKIYMHLYRLSFPYLESLGPEAFRFSNICMYIMRYLRYRTQV